jgi:hypothetical protein
MWPFGKSKEQREREAIDALLDDPIIIVQPTASSEREVDPKTGRCLTCNRVPPSHDPRCGKTMADILKAEREFALPPRPAGWVSKDELTVADDADEPQVHFWCGKPLEELSREELIDAVLTLGGRRKERRE